MTTEPMTPDSPENSAEVGIDVQRLVRQSYLGTVRITIGCMDRKCQVTYYNENREKQDIRGTSSEIRDHINSLPNSVICEDESCPVSKL
jgi:hypothetical protein